MVYPGLSHNLILSSSLQTLWKLGPLGFSLSFRSPFPLASFTCFRCFPWRGFPGGSAAKDLPASTGDAADVGLIPGPGRPPGIGNGSPLQHSCLGNLTDGEPGGLQSTWLPRIGHDRAPEHARMVPVGTLHSTLARSFVSLYLLLLLCVPGAKNWLAKTDMS